MTRFFDKDLADDVGYGIATHVAAVATELHADMERMNAMRKAEGRPSIEEEEEPMWAEFAELLAEGCELAPDVVAWVRGE
ncbi:hypothetical protein PI86_10965 [Burkholderia sp. A9]|uniref:hypothetical protein n=1 Tax=Burkholderia sp. A9 TaxID=1365108 RepID=UPI0005743404|nr:hypothetical protein [Burkholderia sp. A9]KHK58128.1 hypothetical protein PI86_10965 [Burkholderia sp. A9]